jgi:DNA primase
MLDLLQLSRQQRDSLLEAATAYNQQITQRVASYLTGRGLGPDDAAGFLLGEACEPRPGHERFRGMLSIPYLSRAGALGFKFRCPIPDHDCKATHGPKYDSPSGQRARLFNVNALLDKGDTVAIVEGEMAAIIFQTHTGVPTVGTPGTQWQKEHPHWPRAFADFERIFVVADHDVTNEGKTDPGKGVGHAKRVVSTLPGSELILPPPGLDPDEWVQQYGADEVRRSLGVEV